MNVKDLESAVKTVHRLMGVAHGFNEETYAVLDTVLRQLETQFSNPRSERETEDALKTLEQMRQIVETCVAQKKEKEEKPMLLPLPLEEARAQNLCRLCGKAINEAGHGGVVFEFGKEFAHRDCLTEAMKPVYDDMIEVSNILAIVVRQELDEPMKRIIERAFDVLEQNGYKIVKK